MLERLGARAVVGGDDQQRGIDLAGADEHVADELVVARDVDEVELGAVIEREVRVPDVDRHPASTLLGQAVGIDAGQCPEQRRLAVVDVPGRADDDGHARPARAWATADPSASSASGSTVRRSRTTRPASIRPMTAGLPCRSAARRPFADVAFSVQPERRQDLPGQRPAPDRRRESDHRGASADRRRKCLGSDFERRRRHRDHPPHRDRLDGATGAVQAERERDRRERGLVGAHRAGQRVASHPGDQVGPPDDQSGLRPTDQLVPAERDDVGPGLQAFAGDRLVGEAEGRGVEERPGARGRR